MTNLTDALEARVTDYVAKGTTPAALTTPMRVQLVSALGASDAASTPITGGTTVFVTPTWSATTQVGGGAQTSNTAIMRWEGIPNPTTVAGFRILDSAGTPVVTVDNIARTGGSVSVTDGIFEVPASGLTVTSS